MSLSSLLPCHREMTVKYIKEWSRKYRNKCALDVFKKEGPSNPMEVNTCGGDLQVAVFPREVRQVPLLQQDSTGQDSCESRSNELNGGSGGGVLKVGVIAVFARRCRGHDFHP